LRFLDAPQRPLFPAKHLLQATRIHEDVFDRSIDVQVLRLRRKLETDPNTPRVILTERGVGYVFCACPSKHSDDGLSNTPASESRATFANTGLTTAPR